MEDYLSEIDDLAQNATRSFNRALPSLRAADPLAGNIVDVVMALHALQDAILKCRRTAASAA